MKHLLFSISTGEAGMQLTNVCMLLWIGFRISFMFNWNACILYAQSCFVLFIEFNFVLLHFIFCAECFKLYIMNLLNWLSFCSTLIFASKRQYFVSGASMQWWKTLSVFRYEDNPVMFEEMKSMPCCSLSAADYSFCRPSPSASSSDLADPAVPLEATPGDAAPCWLPSGVTTVSEWGLEAGLGLVTESGVRMTLRSPSGTAVASGLPQVTPSVTAGGEAAFSRGLWEA